MVVPLNDGADAKAISSLFARAGNDSLLTLPASATIHNAVFAGSREALERILPRNQERPVPSCQPLTMQSVTNPSSCDCFLFLPQTAAVCWRRWCRPFRPIWAEVPSPI